MGKPPMKPSANTLASFTGEISDAEGYLDMKVYLNNTNICHRFHVLRPGNVNNQVILGLPWQQTYNGVPASKCEGIMYEVEGKEHFPSFLGDEFYSSNLDDEDDETTKIPDKKESDPSIQEMASQSQPLIIISMATKVKPKQVQMHNQASNQLWIPTRLAKAQQGRTYIWIPRRSQPANVRPKQVPLQ